MTVLQSLSRLWAARPLLLARRVQPGRGDRSEPSSAQKSFPATGAHWLDGWVIFGNTYV